VLQHKESISRVIFRITKNREDAEDEVQETFLRAYRGLREFRGNSKFTSWLTRIAVIFIWNLEGAIVGANEAFLRMVQYGREDLVMGRVQWTGLTPF
jgi:PAS domain-containing protein